MCISKHSPQLAYLQPPKGPALKLKQGNTWIGRGTFDMSSKALQFCSRRQARIDVNGSSIAIECEGINPLHFVTCQSKKFQSHLEAQPTELYQLPKGEVIQLTHGDQFFLARYECLITVVIWLPLVSNIEATKYEPGLKLDSLLALENKAGSNEMSSAETGQVSELGVDISGKSGEVTLVKPGVTCRLPGPSLVSYASNENIPGNEGTFHELDKMLIDEVVKDVEAECEITDVKISSSYMPLTATLSFQQRKPFSSVNGAVKNSMESVTSPSSDISRLATELAIDVNSSFASTIPISKEDAGAVMARFSAREHVPLHKNLLRTGETRKNESDIPVIETSCEPGSNSPQKRLEADKPIMGGESVIATVSGYPLAERDKLVKLIQKTGAYYIGSLSKDKPITHVVCWRFSGKKYELAKRWGKVVVNHCWFEDCLKAGRRLSEKPYTLASGEIVGHVNWEEKGDACPLKSSESLVSQVEQHLATLQVHSKTIGHALPEPADGCEQKFEATENAGSEPYEKFENNPQVFAIFEEAVRNIPQEPSVGHGEHNYFETDEIHRLEKDVIVTNERRLVGTWSNHYDESKSARCQQQSLMLGCFKQMEKELLKNPIKHSIDTNAGTEPSCSKRNNSNDASPKLGLYEQLLLKRGKRQLLTRNQSSYLQRSSEKCKLKQQPSSSSHESRSLHREILNCNGNPRNPDNCGTAPHLELEEQASDLLGTNSYVSPTPAAEVTCVICQDQSECSEEGLLTCGHKFCFPCIRRWAYKSQSKAPSCPLCKSPFDFIMKRAVLEKATDNGAAFIATSKEISETVVMVKKQAAVLNLLQQELSCILCQSRDTEELLLVCNGCGERAAHTFCLDPPWPAASGVPWFCARCTRSLR
ncbi:hypothetical protein O6H91_07G038300 [Diphasiastrum complanatum]|uniref:Uncharacterized protein n=1 Tax=Diphasiastrum complanatum TaxID=34168 RepID=A0ACC2D461_DIPCM|nr:hypothetical protein O6H91_07G038300 [Diphasiastrum complanatum]